MNQNQQPNHVSGQTHGAISEGNSQPRADAAIHSAANDRRQASGVPDLIPVRMLNEFSYCPRLGYLEFVDGEWEDSLETKQGTFGHRRVDQPDQQNVSVPGADATDDGNDVAIHARSLFLSAPNEGLIAKLDLVELDGSRALPVDYKRGSVPNVDGNAYEPEQVQLCAQGLILRENGFECTEGVLYFIGSRRRVTIPFTDELIARTRQLRREFVHAAAETAPPPPLIDSPKCPRCALVAICLPDEVTQLRHSTIHVDQHEVAIADPEQTTEGSAGRPGNRPTVRRLIPSRDDALPFYVQEFGAVLGKSGERLQVRKKGEVLGERRLIDISQVSLFGSVMISAQTLSELMVRGIPICHFSHGGWFHGMTVGLVHKNVQLRILQHEVAADASRAVMIARQFIVGKIRNCRTLLRRHLDSSHQPLLSRLDEYRKQAETTTAISSLLGIEGMAAKTYFSGLFQMMRQRHEFSVADRNRRPSRDPVNAVLSFAYALLVKELTITLQAVGFDPMRGLLHQPRYGRPSLALDLSEEYRPLIADSVMLTAFNNGELSSDRFLERAGAVVLTAAGRAAVISAYERRMSTEITHPIFGYRISYRRLLEVQCRLLARTVMGEIEAYPAFCTR